MKKLFPLSWLALTLAGGIIKILFLRGEADTGAYFLAIAANVLPLMLAAVVLPVFWEKPKLAPSYFLLTALSIGLLFYRQELAEINGTYLAFVLFPATLAVWLLAETGCYLRRRLRSMD